MAENLVEESPKQHRTDEGTQRSAGHVSTPAVEDSKNPASISKADVQRELDAVKAERRRRQRALLVARPSKKGPLPSTSCLGASSVSSSSQSLQPHPAQYDDGSSSCAIFTGKADTVKRGSATVGHTELPPFMPGSAIPLHLLRMVYVARPDGGLSPCPGHTMGVPVARLDLSPWEISAHQGELLWEETRKSCLKALKVSGRSGLSLDAIQGLSRLGPQLTSLELSNCSHVSSSALGILLGGTRRLTVLDISGCLSMGDEHVAQVVRACPCLTSLDVSSTLGLTDGGLSGVASTGGLASLKRLFVSKCPGVGDGGLRAVLDGCLSLEDLSASGCDGVTGRAFLGVELPGGMATAPIRLLKQLQLQDCRRLQTSALEWIAAGCTCLHTLDISGCPSTPEGVEMLVSTRPTLLHLTVAGCVGLGGGVALSFVANHGSNLQHLDISDIPATPAGVVQQFLRDCTSLEYIDISGVTSVNRSCFRNLEGCGPVSNGIDEPHGRTTSRPTMGQPVHDTTRNRTPLLSFGGRDGDTEIGRGLPNLRVARMLRLPGLDDASMAAFASACPCLEELLLSDSPMVTGHCLLRLSSLCPLLQSLGLDRCGAASDETALANALRHLPNLKHLSAAREEGRMKTRPGVPGFQRHTYEAKESRRIVKRSYRAPFDGVDCTRSPGGRGGRQAIDSGSRRGASLTGETLLPAAATYCKKLTTLGLEGHSRLTFEEAHAPPGAFPCLTELRLAACSGIGDKGLLVLLKACPRVRTLDVQGSGVSQEALVEASSSTTLTSPFVEVLHPLTLSAVSPNSRNRMRKTNVGKIPPATEQENTMLELEHGEHCPPPSPARMSPSRGASDTAASTTAPMMLASASIGSPKTGSAGNGGIGTYDIYGIPGVGPRGGGGGGGDAIGLRPAAHSELHLAAQAVFSRFDEEGIAVRRLARAFRHFRHRGFQQRVAASKKIQRAVMGYRFRVSHPHPDKKRLIAAKRAVKIIQNLVRASHLRKRDCAAAGFQSSWRRYTARCMFWHQRRLRRAAIGVQKLWRGYYVRTRYRIGQKLTQLADSRNMLGKKWFKAASAAEKYDQHPDAAHTEQVRREEMRDGIRHVKSVVEAELRHLRKSGAPADEPDEDIDRDACRFGTMPPAPRRKLVAGAFDVRPNAKHVRDGREVPFAGEAQYAAAVPSGSVVFDRTRAVRNTAKAAASGDPADFDVFRRATEGLWGDDDAEAAAASARAAAASLAEKPKQSRILCGVCKRCFALVSCRECRRGYCLRCSAYVHAQLARRGHDLGPFQRPEQRPAGVGVQGAEYPLSPSPAGVGGRALKRKQAAAARSLPDCTRRAKGFVHNMGVLTEKEKIKRDEEMTKIKAKTRHEMEDAEERQRKAVEDYELASAELQNAAITVQRACQGFVKRLLLQRESIVRQHAIDEEAKLKMRTDMTRIQSLYRGYSVRKFLKEGTTTVAPRSRQDGGKAEGAIVPAPSRTRNKEIPASRVRRDCAMRRLWEREAAIAELKRLDEESNRIFVTDVRWAVAQHTQLQARHDLILSHSKSVRSARTRLQEEQSLLDPELPPGDLERIRIIKEIKIQELRVQHQSNLLEGSEKGLYWCRAFIRQNYRRHAAHLAQKTGADYTLAWLEEELYAVNEVVGFASKRRKGVADVLEQEFFRGWLADQIVRAGRQRLMIDLEQEVVVETETERTLKGNTHASKCQETLKELLHAYAIDTQLGAERCGAELAAARAEEGADDKVKWISNVAALKDKEANVRGKVQLPLQKGLEGEMSTEETYLQEHVKFNGDVADAPIPQFTKITASLVDPPHHPQHLAFENWRNIYRSQPWLATQTQAENKRKAARASTIEELEEMRAVVATAKSQEAFASKEVSAVRAKIEGFEKRLAFNRSGVPGDAPQELLSNDDRTRMEFDLKQAQEKLADLEERLERRRRGNSTKEAQLRQKEDELEADITAEEQRHAKQAAAMATFHAEERGEAAAEFGKEAADAAVARMRKRLEKLKALQEGLNEPVPAERASGTENKGLLATLKGFVLGTEREADQENEEQEMDYAEQTALIAMRAKRALVSRQIDELNKAKKAITMDFESADAQLMLAQHATLADEDGQEATTNARKMQTKVREARQRAQEAKARQEDLKLQTKKEEAECKAAEAKNKKEAQIAKSFAEDMGMGNVGQADGLKATFKRIQRKVAGGDVMYGGNFDNESAAIEAAIKTKHKSKLGKVEAVVAFLFTVGTEETDAMASKQARLASQGLPSYRKMPKGLGGKDAVFLWVEKSLDSQEFITELQITHADPASRSYKNLRPYGFTSYGHPGLAASGSGKPSILLWGKKDPHSDGIADVDFSYNEADEKKLSDVGFKMVPGLLADCGLPDIRLWCSMVKRGAHMLPSVKAILHELGEVRNLRKENPNDVGLADVETKLESKLSQAREAEERKAEDAKNPLKTAIETYALAASDIDAFIAHFGMMDTDRKGTIDTGDFFEYLRWPRNAFADHLLNFMESADEDGGVDFGDFVKLVCSYCMFGKSDLLRYAYTVYDQGKGFVSFEDLMSLLNDLHKSNAGPIERALREADLERIGQLQFRHFLDLDKRFPKMFYPIANLQLEMRKKFLGEEFWVRKMHLFNETRGNIIKSADGSASKARNAKLREEELAFVKEKARKAFAVTKQGAGIAANRVRENMEKSKWMSKLLS